ncbi:helix-turn-helix domain-containing protein [Sinomicrobium weinanense]|uniref:Helix-turn-helix transcriptional regulator n=1 Tax=Sinomicrobium weinanense TaxID=2842200 RepID=A0A926Q549_9FLAO|nr:AraC family transcriptional regulator [Sinomicrobium weinanense]MBC9797771.1 helix-turn-helix transcriptional regulator [Sinomicrobium weinanense]MBU3122410.1 AraC family transcriptional regulator [Sinomicrobium weinanense]
MKTTLQFNSINEFHEFSNLPKPEHPLISLIDYSMVQYPEDYHSIKWIQNFYSIGLKRNVCKKFNYGQQPYDFGEGVMALIAPRQILHIEIDPDAKADPSGWLLLIHPDFLWNTDLAGKIKKYDFFGYAVNEALFLSEKEENMMIDIFKNIQREYQSNIDKFSQDIIIAQIVLLLNYTERFYERQFITRQITNHKILGRLEDLLNRYFDADDLIDKGIPSVKEVADRLNLTPNYLSSLLKVLTGQSTQQHIHGKLIEKAKEKLSTTGLSVSEIAYELGFEYPASFNKLFKSKTTLSPLEFRRSFN